MNCCHVISAHEHLGLGRLTFSENNWTDYSSSPSQLEFILKQLASSINCKSSRCIIYPQIPYKGYSTPNAYAVTTRYINEQFYNDLSKLTSSIEWYPFIYMRCSDSCKVNENLIELYRNRCFGIKLHPDAEQIDALQVHKSGILELAKEYSLPVTIHCSRPGGYVDYEAIRDVLFDDIQSLNIRFNIAHLGFFVDSFVLQTLPEQIFTDVSPLGVIIDQYCRSGKNPDDFLVEFSSFAFRNSRQIMYGGDYPYNRQRWADGTIHGNSYIDDLSELLDCIKCWSDEMIERLFLTNCLSFLGLDYLDYRSD